MRSQCRSQALPGPPRSAPRGTAAGSWLWLQPAGPAGACWVAPCRVRGPSGPGLPSLLWCSKDTGAAGQGWVLGAGPSWVPHREPSPLQGLLQARGWTSPVTCPGTWQFTLASNQPHLGQVSLADQELLGTWCPGRHGCVHSRLRDRASAPSPNSPSVTQPLTSELLLGTQS